jgi:hypothetical protein
VTVASECDPKAFPSTTRGAYLDGLPSGVWPSREILGDGVASGTFSFETQTAMAGRTRGTVDFGSAMTTGEPVTGDIFVAKVGMP